MLRSLFLLLKADIERTQTNLGLLVSKSSKFIDSLNFLDLLYLDYTVLLIWTAPSGFSSLWSPVVSMGAF